MLPKYHVTFVKQKAMKENVKAMDWITKITQPIIKNILEQATSELCNETNRSFKIQLAIDT